MSLFSIIDRLWKCGCSKVNGRCDGDLISDIGAMFDCMAFSYGKSERFCLPLKNDIGIKSQEKIR